MFERSAVVRGNPTRPTAAVTLGEARPSIGRRGTDAANESTLGCAQAYSVELVSASPVHCILPNQVLNPINGTLSSRNSVKRSGTTKIRVICTGASSFPSHRETQELVQAPSTNSMHFGSGTEWQLITLTNRLTARCRLERTTADLQSVPFGERIFGRRRLRPYHLSARFLLSASPLPGWVWK